MAPVPTPYKHGATAPGCRSCAMAPLVGGMLRPFPVFRRSAGCRIGPDQAGQGGGVLRPGGLVHF